MPHPSATVLGQEIFQSGLVPSYTDFQEFTKLGKIPGLDFAHIRNGYRYHKEYDTADQISGGSLQHTGMMKKC